MTRNRRGLAGIILIFLILIGDILTGAVSSRAPFTDTSFSCDGTFHPELGRCEQSPVAGVTCTIPSGNSVCNTITVTFSPAFTNAPNPSDVSIIPNVYVGTAVNVVDQFSYGKDVFFSLQSAGQTWINMPAAQTEIFGDGSSQHRIIADWGNMTQADMVLNCPTASTGVSATLTVQYSLDLGVTWTSIPVLSINLNANCALGEPIDTCFANHGQTTFGCYDDIPVAARVKGVLLRLVGQNGSGVGDSPNFISAYIITHTASTITTLANTCSPEFTLGGLPTTTSFKYTFRCSAPQPTGLTFTTFWKVLSAKG